MYNLSSEAVRGGTLCFSKAGLAEGTAAATIKIAAPNGAGVDYSIDGVMYHYADEVSLLLTANTVQALLTSCLYLLTLNSTSEADGTSGGTLVKGKEVLTADVTSGKRSLEWPQPSLVTECPIGAFRVDVTTILFTSGTTDIATITGGTGSVTYYDLFAIPDTPLTS